MAAMDIEIDASSDDEEAGHRPPADDLTLVALYALIPVEETDINSANASAASALRTAASTASESDDEVDDAMGEADADAGESEDDSAAAGAGGGGGRGAPRGRVREPAVEVEEEEEGGGEAPLRTKNEVPLGALPIPVLPVLLAGPGVATEPAGTLLHVHLGAEFDPMAALEGGKGGKGKAAKGREEGSGGGDCVDVYTLVVQAVQGGRPLDERSALALPDRRLVGFVEDVFGPVKSPLYLLRVRVRRSVGVAEVEAAMVGAGLHPGDCGYPPALPAPPLVSALSMLADAYGEGEEEGFEVVPEGAAPPQSWAEGAAGPVATLVSIADLRPGLLLHAVKPLSRWIVPEALAAAYPRGSDASNVWDEEVGAEEVEYSDDEAEAAGRSRAKAVRRREGARPGEGVEAEPDGALIDAHWMKEGGGGRGGGRERGGRGRGGHAAGAPLFAPPHYGPGAYPGWGYPPPFCPPPPAAMMAAHMAALQAQLYAGAGPR